MVHNQNQLNADLSMKPIRHSYDWPIEATSLTPEGDC